MEVSRYSKSQVAIGALAVMALATTLTTCRHTTTTPTTYRHITTTPTTERLSEEKNVVYEHLSVFDGLGVGGRTSQSPTNGFASVRMYDNFTVDKPTPVTGVRWMGFYCANDVAVVDSFTVSIRSDKNGPGQLLFTETREGSANEAPIGTKFFVPDDNEFCGPGDVAVYEYSFDFSGPFTPDGSTTYWLSIVASSTFPPYWAWHFGHGNDSRTAQDFQGERTLRNERDLCFQLISGS